MPNISNLKIGELINKPNKVFNSGEVTDSPIVVSETIDTNLYTDITSIENWDKIGIDYIEDMNTLRDGIFTIVSNKGWSNLTVLEKEISSKWFCVDKVNRDEVNTDNEQKSNINRIGKNQLNKRSKSFEEIFDYNKESIDKYLNQIRISNSIKSTEFSKVGYSNISTTSNTYTLLDNFVEVSIGSYYLNFNCNISGPNTGVINTSVFINGIQVSGSERTWESNNSPGNGRSVNRNTHSYNNFPITINSLSDISIMWKTELGIARASNITFSLIKL